MKTMIILFRIFWWTERQKKIIE